MEWLRDLSGAHEPVTTLLCFPPAGGGAYGYRNWARRLPAHFGVVAVELPGHGSRLGEPLVSTLPGLLGGGLLGEVRTLLDRPVVVLGHSMGAIVAAALCRALLAEDGWRPLLFVAAGCAAPDLPSVPDYDMRMTDQGILDFLRDAGGTPSGILGNEEYLAMIRPVVRADLDAIAHRDLGARPRLGCPVRSYVGGEDPRVSADRAAGWVAESDGDFEQCTFPGGHFFLHDNAEMVLSRLQRDIGDVRHRARGTRQAGSRNPVAG
ncbi:alpha/beta fold hydrolase [Amycolatopsis sp. NPDC005232]|uniref:thioesterase II family protein n=1 Tax=Amycolatopsis sp. NPDC005232 TaxID=3157027 RepID=UPI0033BB8C19